MTEISLRQKKEKKEKTLLSYNSWLCSNHQTEGSETETVSFQLWWKMVTVNLVEKSFDNTNFTEVHNTVMHSLLQISQCFSIGVTL